jgi:hypothetical protein
LALPEDGKRVLFSPQLIGRSSFRAAGGGGGGHSAEAIAFLARTSGLDTTHTNAYYGLIDGLVSDGVWSKFDVLRIYATQDSATALLNLISSSYAAITHGSPTFTADRGFTGVNGSTSVYIDSQFNPTANGQGGGGQYGQDSNHISAWSVNNVQSQVVMGVNAGSTRQTNMNLFNSGDNKAYFRSNIDPGTADLNVVVSDSLGHYIANRSASNAVQGYKNGSSIVTGSNASTSLPNSNVFDLAQNSGGSAANGGSWQVAATSMGSSLSSTNASNFYSRLRTYMTAVGVP